MELAHPRFLALALVCVPLLVWAMRWSLAEMTPTQRRVCLAARAQLLLCIVLALAGVRVLRRGDDLGVLFVVDDSASISPEARAEARKYVETSLRSRRPDDVAGVVGFATKAAVWQPPVESSQLAAAWPESPADTQQGTDIGSALNFAASLLPPEKARRVILLTDGNDTSGQAVGTINQGDAGLEIWTVPLHNPPRPEVLVTGVDLPRGLKSGESFDLRADVRSNVDTPAKVQLYQNQFLVASRDVILRPGTNDTKFSNLQAGDGFTAYEVEVVPPPGKDTRPENNRASATAALGGEPRVLLIDGDEAKVAPLAGALRAAKIEVETRGPAGLPRTLEELQRYDLFMLSDVSALSMSRDQMELYRTWVQQFGGGFLMIGGENSFGVGGYYRTPIEQMLPVRMEHDDRQETPSVALYVVLDRSGSMTAPVAGTTKIALADQGAVLALNVLQPRDFFGLTAVDTKVNTVAPLERVGSKPALESKILSITAGGGGIYIYTSLVDAARVLRDSPAKIKHVILFSDAADAEEKTAGEMPDGTPGSGNSVDVVSAMLANEITTSVVGLGAEQDKDVAFLRLLAERGNGRFYLTNDATNLPQIFSTETMKVAQSSLVEEPFNPVPAMPSPLSAGIDWKVCPPLLGYNTTKGKPTAEIALSTELGEPLLASWRYGLGQAAAFTSDAKARWAGEWLGWDGFGKFWAQVARGLLRRGERGGGFQVRTTELGDGTRLRLDIDALTPEGGFRDRLPVNVTALDTTSGDNRQIAAEQIAPGSYRAEIPLPPLAGANSATTMLSISSPEMLERPYVFGHTRSYPREFLRLETDEAALRAIAAANHGKFTPEPASVFAPPERLSVRREDLTNFFLAAALLLMPIDIFIRRRAWKHPPKGE